MYRKHDLMYPVEKKLVHGDGYTSNHPMMKPNLDEQMHIRVREAGAVRTTQINYKCKVRKQTSNIVLTDYFSTRQLLIYVGQNICLSKYEGMRTTYH